jgi:hypothetical protein
MDIFGWVNFYNNYRLLTKKSMDTMKCNYETNSFPKPPNAEFDNMAQRHLYFCIHVVSCYNRANYQNREKYAIIIPRFYIVSNDRWQLLFISLQHLTFWRRRILLWVIYGIFLHSYAQQYFFTMFVLFLIAQAVVQLSGDCYHYWRQGCLYA